MIPVLLDHAEHTRRGRKARHSGRDGALREDAAGAVDRYAAAWDRDDDRCAWAGPGLLFFAFSTGRVTLGGVVRATRFDSNAVAARIRAVGSAATAPEAGLPPGTPAADATASVGKSVNPLLQLQRAARVKGRKACYRRSSAGRSNQFATHALPREDHPLTPGCAGVAAPAGAI